MIEYIVALVVLWIIGFMVHEFGHVLGALLSGGKAEIKVWKHKGIPSMMTVPIGKVDRNIFLLSGGLTTGWIYILLQLLAESPPLKYGLLIVGLVNFAYALYEVLLKDRLHIDVYMKWHYVLYVVVIFIGTGIFLL